MLPTSTLLSCSRSMASRGTPSPATNTRAPPLMTSCDLVGDLARARRSAGRRRRAWPSARAPWPSPRPSRSGSWSRRRGSRSRPASRHGGGQAVVRHPAHAGEHHRVLDLEEVGEARSHGACLAACRRHRDRLGGAATPPWGVRRCGGLAVCDRCDPHRTGDADHGYEAQVSRPCPTGELWRQVCVSVERKRSVLLQPVRHGGQVPALRGAADDDANVAGR